MKRFAVGCSLVLLGIGGEVSADCPALGYDLQLTDTSRPPLFEALSQKRIRATSPDTGEEWNEDHCTNGNLFKLGDGSSKDPRAYRGTWSTSGDTVTYDYGGPAVTYDWQVFQNSSLGLCWQDTGGTVIATAPAPDTLSDSCTP